MVDVADLPAARAGRVADRRARAAPRRRTSTACRSSTSPTLARRPHAPLDRGRAPGPGRPARRDRCEPASRPPRRSRGPRCRVEEARAAVLAAIAGPTETSRLPLRGARARPRRAGQQHDRRCRPGTTRRWTATRSGPPTRPARPRTAPVRLEVVGEVRAGHAARGRGAARRRRPDRDRARRSRRAPTRSSRSS